MSARADALSARVAEAGLDAILISDLADLRYVTGFTGSAGLALVGPKTRTFATDFRYEAQSAEQVDATFERQISTGSGELLDLIARGIGDGHRRVGFDDRALTVHQHTELRRRVAEAVELVAAGDVIRGLRAVKDGGELVRIRDAIRIADQALTEVLAQGLVGRTERAVAAALEDAMRAGGASGPSFDSIVAAGPHGALPHAQPRDVTIEAGQLVTIDWGARVDGYCSDCTRTVAAGTPTDRAQEIHALVLEALHAGVAAARPGAEGVAVDAAAREVIERAGHGEHFGHALGHGVGLAVHEPPSLSRRSSDVLRAGEVVTVEPGVYLPGELGVRIEQMIRVGEDGAEVLTGTDPALTVT